MHRAILVSLDDELEADAIQLSESSFSKGEATSETANNAPGLSGVSSAASEHKDLQNPDAVEGLVGRTLADVERDMILNTLGNTLGNRTHAAKILGISIRTLRNKLNQYKDEGTDIPASSAG